MNSPINDIVEYDVLVVGSGIVGLGHALAAVDAGRTVVVIDRDASPVGASIRNFGHICATGQSGDLRDLALGTRARWLALASRANLDMQHDAGMAVARADDELAVLEELADSRESVTLMSPAQVRTELGGIGARDIVGGARLGDDLRVDPRTTVPHLVSWLDSQIDFRWRTAYLGVDDTDGDGTTVRTSRGLIRAQHVFVCVGHDIDYLAPTVADDAGVQRCSLQMLLARDPGFRIRPAVLTATSMLRYAAFAETAAAATLARNLGADRPELLAADTNIMFTQRPDGSILIGDSHRTDLSVPPFTDELTSELILQEVETVLGTRLEVQQRWQGIYATRPGGPYLIAEIAPNVYAASVTTGVGMTVGLELAARHVASRLYLTFPLLPPRK